jgi:sugar lactone lactonase YvrE
MAALEHVLPSRNKLGEGPVWDANEQVLYWVDIKNNNYARFDPVSGLQDVYDVGVPIGVLAVRSRGGLVMATKNGFAFWDPKARRLEYIKNPEQGKPYMRFNDGEVDSRGRFWAGTMSEAENPQPEGALYRLDPDLSIHVMETGLGISNGLGWSPDDGIMYLTDSARKVIYAYDFDAATGSITNRRVFVDATNEPYDPDGLKVDSQGYVWSACWNGAKVLRYSPDGKVERTIDVPALRTTSCVFAGPDLTDLYITSSRDALTPDQLENYPFSGDLFRLRTDVKGLPQHKFLG